MAVIVFITLRFVVCMKSFHSKKLRGKIFSLLTKTVPAHRDEPCYIPPGLIEKNASVFSSRCLKFAWFMPRLVLDESHDDFSPCLQPLPGFLEKEA